MQTIELSISGMTCGACVGHVTKALQGVPGVQKATVDLAGAQAIVAGESLDVAQLTAAVEEEGYGAAQIADVGSSGAKNSVISLTAQGCSCCN